MRKKIIVAITCGIIATGCAGTNSTYKGAGVGAVGGASIGALLDKKDPWRGAVIGGAIGTVIGASFGKIVDDATQEAAETNRQVVYRKDNMVVEATPIASNKHTHCKKVRKRIWKNGRLIRDEIQEVCEAEKEENIY